MSALDRFKCEKLTTNYGSDLVGLLPTTGRRPKKRIHKIIDKKKLLLALTIIYLYLYEITGLHSTLTRVDIYK